MIILNNITCSYDKHSPVFTELSLELRDHLIFIFGSNGVGKTSLFKCIMGRLPVSSGSISINGIPLHKMSERELSKMIALVPQECTSATEYSVIDFISFGRTPYLNVFERPSKEDYNLVYKYMVENNIEHLKNKKMNELSGGERQLVYITRAMVQETPIIVMDEPMSALDYDNQALILQLIKRLAEQNKYVILSSHNPNHALAFSANVIMIDKERKFHYGNAWELLSDNEMLLKTFGKNVKFEGESRSGNVIFMV